MAYYVDRLGVYYSDEDRRMALLTLDSLAHASDPIAFGDLFNLLKSRVVTEDAERSREVLSLLQRDHYVIRDSKRRYSFRFPLIKWWWKLHRDNFG
jgi:hypothetical protein